MNVESINTEVFPVGINEGKPCVLVSFNYESEDMPLDDIIRFIRKSNLKTVCLAGSIVENPEIKTLAKSLSGVGYKVIILTDCADSIEALRRLQGVLFVLKVRAPTEEENTVNPKNLPLLKEEDELIFKIESEEDFNNATRFLKGKLITRPTASFIVANSQETGAILEKYLSWAGDAIYNTRCYV